MFDNSHYFLYIDEIQTNFTNIQLININLLRPGLYIMSYIYTQAEESGLLVKCFTDITWLGLN